MYSMLGDVYQEIFDSDRICHRDCFDAWSQLAFNLVYDIATLAVGLGTNEITSVPSFNTLITGNVANDQEGTRGITAPFVLSTRAPRMQISVSFDSLVTRMFCFGMINPGMGGEYTRFIYDSSLSPNWTLWHTTGGVDTMIDTGIPAVIGDTRLELTFALDGRTNARVRRTGEDWRGIDCSTLPVLDPDPTLNYFFQYELITLDNVVSTAWVDYIEWERNKA